MLDVHPPHAPTHTWTDFFIHISTICVGLLIAIGLEQSVEAIHRHGERSDLVESLQHESEQILRDANGELNTLIERVDDAYKQRVDAMSVELETQNQLRFSRQLGSAPSLGALDLSAGVVVLRGITLSEEDLKQIFKDTIHLEIKAKNFIYWSRQARGAATALKAGERKLAKIDEAERQFDNVP